METNRRRFLGGVAVAAASAGCLQGSEADSGDGGEPTTAVPEDPRVDEPPYEIAAQPNDQDAWNERYLCEQMPGDSDLEFRQVSAPRPDPLLSLRDHDDGDAYAVRALTSADEVREVFETEGDGDGESEESLDRIDFEEDVLLVAEDGFGSGSVTHHWKRAETTDRGCRLHGCLVKPYVRTDDLTSRHSVVRVERPDDFEFARVSLTVDEDRRVHFNSTEGVVSVDSGT